MHMSMQQGQMLRLLAQTSSAQQMIDTQPTHRRPHQRQDCQI